MKRLCGIFLVVGCLLAPVRAQDAGSPEVLRAAQELAAIITGDTISQMSSTLTAQLWPRIESQFSGKVDDATLADLRSEFERALALSTAEMMKDAPAIYARHFNAQELRDLLAFYKSPTGKKALQTMPTVMADVTTQMMPRMEVFQRDLSARIEAVMQKHGYKN
jgi:uncharacterized protein